MKYTLLLIFGLLLISQSQAQSSDDSGIGLNLGYGVATQNGLEHSVLKPVPDINFYFQYFFTDHLSVYGEFGIEDKGVKTKTETETTDQRIRYLNFPTVMVYFSFLGKERKILKVGAGGFYDLTIGTKTKINDLTTTRADVSKQDAGVRVGFYVMPIKNLSIGIRYSRGFLATNQNYGVFGEQYNSSLMFHLGYYLPIE